MWYNFIDAIKKYCTFFILFCFLGMGSGCVYRLEYFEHVPTDKYRKNITLNELSGLKDFVDEEVAFVPNFREMTKSFADPRSFLRLYSGRKTTVFFDKVILCSKDCIKRKELVLNKEVVIDQKVSNNSVFYGFTLLFDYRNTNMEDFFHEEALYIEVFYHFPNHKQLNKMRFKLELVEGWDIAWPT